MSGRNPVGLSDEWYTPAYVFEALCCRFDLDVASPEDRTHCAVPANRFITVDSLTATWIGFVWMNPPFGGRNDLYPWLDKFLAHGDGVALTPDRTSAPWFQQRAARADALLFCPKVRFIGPDGKKGGSPFDGTCLWAIGERGEEALHAAALMGLGVLVKPA